MKNQNCEIIKSIRQCHKMTQREYAEALHVSLRTLQGWESRSCPDYVLSLIREIDSCWQQLSQRSPS